MGLRATIVGVTFACVCLTVQAQAVDWKPVGNEGGFAISRRAGSGPPAFRGVGPMQGNIELVLAVLRDVASINQWVYGITQAELIRHVSERVDDIYLYSRAPWPLRSRDMTVRREIRELRRGADYRIILRCQTGLRPPRREVVRVQRCHSEFRLRRLSDQVTQVEYWARLDPAGRLPSWANNWMARNVPGRSLTALQQRVSQQGR